jgi:ketosteroid isomerase-like protein
MSDIVLAAEEARRKAMVAADLDALDALLADDCLYVHSTGQIDTKQSYLAKLADGTIRYITCDAEAVQPLDLGQTVIVMHHMLADITLGGQPRSIRSQAAAVWQLTDGGVPKLVYFQGTPLPA